MPVNRLNFKKYATAAVKLMIIFLEHLQKIGIYDDSLVVILGDHGAGGIRGRYSICAPGCRKRDGGKVVSERLPHLSHAAGPVQAPFRPRRTADLDAPVSLGDVPATVFSDLGLPVQAPGIPMQALDDSARRERRFLIYAGRDIFSYYGDMTEYIVSGYGWLDESWRPSGRIFTRHGRTGQPR